MVDLIRGSVLEPVCRHCGSLRTRRINARIYGCRDCRGKFSMTAGTLFEKTTLPLVYWIHAIEHSAVNSFNLARELGIATSWTSEPREKWRMLLGINKSAGLPDVKDSYRGEMNSRELARDLDVTQKTAWKMLFKIRKVWDFRHGKDSVELARVLGVEQKIAWIILREIETNYEKDYRRIKWALKK